MGVRPTENTVQQSYMSDAMYDRDESAYEPKREHAVVGRAKMARRNISTPAVADGRVYSRERVARPPKYGAGARDNDWQLVATSGNKIHAPGSRAYVQPLGANRDVHPEYRDTSDDYDDEVFSGVDSVYAENMRGAR